MAEATSARIAAIAGHVAKLSDTDLVTYAEEHPDKIRALAASALTQAPNRKRAK